MRIESDVKLDFKDVLIRPKRSTLKSRSEVNLERTMKFRNSGRTWTGVPVIAANMDTTGTFEMALQLSKSKCLVAIHKETTVEEWSSFSQRAPEAMPFVCVSSGTSDKDLARLREIVTAVESIEFICLDVANGYSEHFVDFLRVVRKAFPTHTIIAGNVVTGEMTEELILSGADVVKVGIGPGSVCTTRKMTGVGYPQLSATIECADAAHGVGGHVVADGGCTSPGDIAKAFGGGTDFVMLGGMLAGHDESAGEMVEKDGKKFKMFYGMSSATAMTKYRGSVANYRASEGKTVTVPYRGPVEDTMRQILGGLRSACTYVGARQLKYISKCTTFVRVTMQLNQVFSNVELATGSGYAKDEKAADPPAKRARN